MPNSFLNKFVTGLFVVCFMTVGQAQEVGSKWLLQVQDLKHKTKAEATIRFTSEPATESCMRGEWRRIIIEEKTAQDEKFFPLSGPLAYIVDSDSLTLGRTNVCDAYLFLSGKPDSSHIQGQFNFGGIMGSQKLGDFSLKRVH